MNAYQLSESEWYFAESLDDAYKAAEEFTGMSRSDYEKEFEFVPRQLPESELSEKIAIVDDADKVQGSMTMREAIRMKEEMGEKYGFLCGHDI